MLRHSTDSEPGYTRRKQGRSWAYFDEDGKRITDRDEIDRLNAIALPPAYDRRLVLQGCQRPSPGDRRRCARPQAISLSRRLPRSGATRRKYDGRWNSATRCPGSGAGSTADLQQAQARPRNRARGGRPPARHASISAIGNEEYARDNKSFGATTLRIPPRPAQGRQADDALHRQARHRPRSDRSPTPT